tara:strand:+ start:396 stop:530 length:135 start_codon:yes stop_codon:yes gene_type:complete
MQPFGHLIYNVSPKSELLQIVSVPTNTDIKAVIVCIIEITATEE